MSSFENDLKECLRDIYSLTKDDEYDYVDRIYHIQGNIKNIFDLIGDAL